MSKPETVSKSPEKSDRVKNGGDLPGRGEQHLQRWIVRRSHFPLTLLGEVVGHVEAPDRYGAGVLATARFGCGAYTVEPEHRVNPQLERVVDRAVKAAGRKARGGFGFARARFTKPDGDAA